MQRMEDEWLILNKWNGTIRDFCCSSSFVDKPTHPLRSSRVIVPWKGFFFACLICQPSTTQPPTKEEVPQAVLEGPFIARNHQLFWSLPAPTPQSLVPLAVGGRDDLLECESTFLLDLCGWGRGREKQLKSFPGIRSIISLLLLLLCL